MAIRHYKLVLTTVGPIHIGNGSTYTGKDYFKLDSKTVGVLDAKKFVGLLSPEDLDEYCIFLSQSGSRLSLQTFLNGHRNLQGAAERCVAYRVEMALAKARRGSDQYFDVFQFVKGADGLPYVPGSSVKGMLRTALLSNLILRDRESYARLYDSAAARNGRDSLTACKAIERKAFWQEKPDDSDATLANDIMRYVSVSDSVPLSTSDLVFVKKYDRFSRGDSAEHKLSMGKISNEPEYFEGNALNIYRECIKPGSRIELTIDIDEKIDAYLDGLCLDREGLISIFETSYELYKRCFLDGFDVEGAMDGGADDSVDDGRCHYVYASGPSEGMRCRNRSFEGTGYCRLHQEHASPIAKTPTCYLGGGVDFDSKTVINALFESSPERIDEISRILYAQFPTWLDPSMHRRLEGEIREAGFVPDRRSASRRNGRLIRGKDDHRHWKDAELGVSPHTLKLGIMGDKKYPMGKCSIAIEESR